MGRRFVYSSQSICWRSTDLWETSSRTEALVGTILLSLPQPRYIDPAGASTSANTLHVAYKQCAPFLKSPTDPPLQYVLSSFPHQNQVSSHGRPVQALPTLHTLVSVGSASRVQPQQKYIQSGYTIIIALFKHPQQASAPLQNDSCLGKRTK